MADKDQPKKKRRLRTPSETVRERAVRSQESVNTGPKHGFFWGVGWPLRMVFRGLAWLSHRPPLKQLGHGLRWFFSLKLMRFLGKVLGVQFILSSARELRLVAWPTARQSRQLTLAVIIFSIVFGGLIAGVDYGLDKLFKQVILKG